MLLSPSAQGFFLQWLSVLESCQILVCFTPGLWVWHILVIVVNVLFSLTGFSTFLDGWRNMCFLPLATKSLIWSSLLLTVFVAWLLVHSHPEDILLGACSLPVLTLVVFQAYNAVNVLGFGSVEVLGYLTISSLFWFSLLQFHPPIDGIRTQTIPYQKSLRNEQSWSNLCGKNLTSVLGLEPENGEDCPGENLTGHFLCR